MIVEPKVRGFICTTAHPAGCEAHVKQWMDYVKQQKTSASGPKRVLIIGASTGFGLAARIALTFGMGSETIGVFFEKPANGKRTASAGWYNTAAFEKAAAQANSYAKSINGDAFSKEIKAQTLDLIRQDWGGKVDLVVYSIASPRRVHPETQAIYSSVLKPIGQSFEDKSVDVMEGRVTQISISPANDEEIAHTVAVMGGEDWKMWMDALQDNNLLADKAKTVAFTYIGPELTYPIYRHGTIGRAKLHLEETAKAINEKLQSLSGQALISVNKALVTQASAAIPVVPLYISLLYKVMKQRGTHEGCIEQMWRLFCERLYSGDKLLLDEQGRIRIDDLEMQAEVQSAVQTLWQQVTTDNLASLADVQGYLDDFYHLFGFGFSDVDYNQDIEVDVAIGSIS